MSKAKLFEHLQTGVTHVCQCWAITRRDGQTYGFTDHDRPLAFEGITFLADSGMSAKALSATTGLSVNNTEALGLLQSHVISEADIAAGRYDSAEVKSWTVQWDDVANRQVRFAGTIGEISRDGGQFQAELRGITEGLNQPQGRSYLRTCSAVLGDDRCAFNLNNEAYRIQAPVLEVLDKRVFVIAANGFSERWFEQGKLTVHDGAAHGLSGIVKHDVQEGALRRVTMWHALRADVVVGDTISVVAGCDKRAETCRVKFSNFVNFQGFPDMPGEDWLVAVPRSSDVSDGGSLVR